MSETLKPLDRETLERLVSEWDKRSGKGPFSLIARVWSKPDGTQGDAIHIVENRKEVEVITDREMTTDL